MYINIHVNSEISKSTYSKASQIQQKNKILWDILLIRICYLLNFLRSTYTPTTGRQDYNMNLHKSMNGENGSELYIWNFLDLEKKKYILLVMESHVHSNHYWCNESKIHAVLKREELMRLIRIIFEVTLLEILQKWFYAWLEMAAIKLYPMTSH
jgi:hypothetical protein